MWVTTTIGSNHDAVADYTLGLILDLARHITEISNKTKGLVGAPGGDGAAGQDAWASSAPGASGASCGPRRSRSGCACWPTTSTQTRAGPPGPGWSTCPSRRCWSRRTW